MLERAAEQRKQAQEVAEARALFWETRSAKYDAAIESLFTGDTPDANLDPRIAAIVNGWLRAED